MTTNNLREEFNLTAIQAVRRLNAAALESALARGDDPNETDQYGMTALHHAAAKGERPCIRLLVASGKCDYLLRDNKGRYAFELAIQWGRDFAVARLLMKKQAMQAHERGVPTFVLRDS